ncbi:hypothetical protein GCM10027191_14410 [Novilysobacter erysipheiresistens]
MLVWCTDTSANAGLLAPTISSGAAHPFSIRPKPASIGIDTGGSRTQPSVTVGWHSFAPAGHALNAMITTASNGEARNVRIGL